ncbi:GlsB/YeaQ/YmgE family stress response membrane protein [Pengzhenrongella frigida]|uniref:GlsB/YeaQ/YmgE family stress response membrane protein n=1 Tax=Pengzhenrongella frigida TaxID=1259133 RepID=A0A4Q5MYQ0_9MICO|nr:GlsB/YeaQ/YmgE family stress response membrane protein [Cellulomonas sp. HLT2-17]RYV49367.1 GlsB/YeaQ/YmgE family stress response membrane protein [Cellulomonas sp. HLT2-17]
MTASGFITAVVIVVVVGAPGRLFATGKQISSILATIVIGVFAAILGPVLASALSSADTTGIDWIEFLFQVVLAVVGVTLAARTLGGRRG